jgi:hypothetical protein
MDSVRYLYFMFRKLAWLLELLFMLAFGILLESGRLGQDWRVLLVLLSAAVAIHLTTLVVS